MKKRSFPIRRAAWLAAWAGSLAVAYYLGRDAGGGGSFEESRRSALQRIASSSSEGRPLSKRSGSAAPTAAIKGADGEIAEGLAGSDAARATDFAERFAGVQSMPPGVARNEAYFALIKEWAAADGPAAIAAAGAITEPKLRYELRESALRSWATASPEAAWKFASENASGDLPDNRMSLVFEGLGRSDPAKALAFMEANGKALEKYGDRAALVFDDLYEHGHHDALVGWAEKMPAGKLRDMATNRIIDRWARYDPAAAKEWMDKNVTTKDNLVPARVELAESWARVDPSAALQWANSLPAGQRDSEYYSRIYGRWIQYDRNAAAKNLAEQPPSAQLDRPIERYTYEVMRQNPAETMPWAESISDSKRRWEAVSRVAEYWGRRDPGAMQNYVAASNLTDEQKRQLLKPIEQRKKP